MRPWWRCSPRLAGPWPSRWVGRSRSPRRPNGCSPCTAAPASRASSAGTPSARSGWASARPRTARPARPPAASSPTAAGASFSDKHRFAGIAGWAEMRALAGSLTYTARPPAWRVPGRRAVPELPEVETLRTDLEHEVVGRKITDVEVRAARTVRRHRNRKEFAKPLLSERVAVVERQGAHRVVDLAPDGELFVAAAPELGELQELHRAAIDPLTDAFTWQSLGAGLLTEHARLRPL